MGRFSWSIAAAAQVFLGVAPIAFAAPAAHAPDDYVYAGSIDFGAPGAWDYASFDHGRLYIGHSDTIAVIDTVTGKVASTIPVGMFVNAVALSPDGSTLYASGFTESSPGALFVIDTATQKITDTIGSVQWPTAVAVAPAPPVDSAYSDEALGSINHPFPPVRIPLVY